MTPHKGRKVSPFSAKSLITLKAKIRRGLTPYALRALWAVTPWGVVPKSRKASTRRPPPPPFGEFLQWKMKSEIWSA